MIRLDTRFFSPELKNSASEFHSEATAALAAVKRGDCAGGEFTGWYDWPRRHGFALAQEVKQHVAGIGRFYDTVVVIGIGGSYLGCRAVVDALTHSFHASLSRGPKAGAKPQVVYAGHNLSEAGLIELLDFLADREPIVNVISKSGTTTEPAVAFRVIRDHMEQRYGKAEAAKRIIATTDGSKGALRRLAGDAGYKTFVVPDDVGGRFSVLTAVGLVPLALAGFDIDSLLTGADQLFRSLDGEGLSTHPVIEYATLRRAAFEAGKRVEILAYGEPRLATVVEWWKQLFGESEGKSGQGMFPAGLSYTTDLHSLGQYVQDGCRNLIQTFLNFSETLPAAVRTDQKLERRLRVPHAAHNDDDLGYLEGRHISDINQAAMIGTKVAHSDGGVPSLELNLRELSESSLGELFAFFETACAVSALLLGVNPFDQPGVEAYKKNLFALLGKPGFEELGGELRRRL